MGDSGLRDLDSRSLGENKTVSHQDHFHCTGLTRIDTWPTIRTIYQTIMQFIYTSKLDLVKSVDWSGASGEILFCGCDRTRCLSFLVFFVVLN